MNDKLINLEFEFRNSDNFKDLSKKLINKD